LNQAKTIAPEGPLPIQEFLPTASGLYLNYLDGGPSSLVFVDFWTKKSLNVPMRGALPGQPDPPASPTAIQQMLVLRGDELLFRSATYLDPPAWHLFDPNQTRGRAQLTALREPSSVDFSDAEVVRVSVKSKDGAKVPLNLIWKKGTRLNGANPTILTGYGGYGISLAPAFDAGRRLWLDQGGVIAVANLRGGGEFGEDWHKAGNLLKKQNVFDDFLACAEWLVRSNLTRPDKLAIRGGSNGGLLMGAALTQRPDLFGAVVSQVGIYDMLRVELDPNGAFNVTEFKVLYGYSPYHRVRDGVRYPPALLTTGENDGRVNPAHSRKMTARLQASGTPGPVLLRTSGSGHGIGTAFSERVAEWADLYAFLVRQLGLNYTQIERGPWSGAVTATSVWVKAKLASEGLTARLVVSKQADFSQPLVSRMDYADAALHNLVAFRLDHLEPDTQYHYTLEIDGRLDRGRPGRFHTFPQGPASFTIAWATCARTASTSDVFDRIREHQPLVFINAGDIHYLDINENSVAKFRAAYDRVLASPQQADLYRNAAFVYIWDDHDFGGNNCDKTVKSSPAARGVYQEYMPHYPLAAGGGDVPIYQSFDIGRVKFLLTDMRSERDPVNQKDDAKKSMLGPAQKAWLKQEMLAANGRYPLIVWVGSVSLLGERGTNYYPLPSTNVTGVLHHEPLIAAYQAELAKGKKPRPAPDEEHWCAFTTERREIADFIKANRISGVCYLHGDMHALSADDGSHGDYATGGGAPIPSMGAASLDKEPSIKGGPYSQGVYRPKPPEGCFGLLNVADKGDTIEVAFSGRNSKDEEKITLKFSVPAKPAATQ
jgi:phosphodiesterase/alkaline phosphatase D-like protein/dienelactone hydrolase